MVVLLTAFWSCRPSPADYTIAPVSFAAVRIEDGFWSPRMEANRLTTVPVCFRKCEETGRIDNFAKAGGLLPGEFRGIRYDDSDVYKVIEGASYALALHPDPALDRYLDELIAKIAAAQEDDGYLYTARTIDPSNLPRDAGETRWSYLEHSHELYNVGHLYEAAVAHFQATGKRTLLDVALENANLIDRTFGPGKLQDPPGHEEIEVGLVKLYRVTGDRRYLDLAKFFIDRRGRPEGRAGLYGEYSQDHQPVTDQAEPVGHAVRAGYLYSAMADLAAITGEASYAAALDRIWARLMATKIYLTGGIGAERGHEGFGPDYHLPNATAYNETCAAVALALWSHRMFQLHGEGRYIDVLERVLYNGFLSGVSLAGDAFFYPNPLASDGVQPFNQGSLERSPWFATACCPVNVVRFVPSIAGYIYAHRDGDVFVNLYVGSSVRLELRNRDLKLVQETRYPWDGRVRIAVEPERPARFALHLRIPGWARGQPLPSDLYQYVDATPGEVTLKLNGEVEPLDVRNGYARIERRWVKGDVVDLEIPMPIRRVVAHPKVQANDGRVALERGPLVYCVEGVDHGGSLGQLVLSDGDVLEAQFRPELLGGVTMLVRKGDEATPFQAVPYYAWNHRGAGEMEVWVTRRR
jgi:hypothetical protein